MRNLVRGLFRRMALSTALACAAAATVHAQGTISDGPASFVRNSAAFSNSPSANFTGVSPTLTQDHVFEFGWFFRVGTGVSESALPLPTTQSYLGNTSTLTWSSLAGGAFSALEVLTLTNTGGPSGNILATMSLTNTGNLPLSLFLFHMLDMDLQPTASNDTASLAGPNLIRLTDAGTNAAFYQGIGANAWLVRPFGATDIGAVMPDGAETNFNNSGLPFGPNDFTAGFQWNLLIDPGQTLQAQVLVGVNDPLPASDVPEPASFALLAAGLLGMKLFRRWQS